MNSVNHSNPSLKYWQGKISIGYGIGYFAGFAGDNSPHSHHAHQLSFSKTPQHNILVKVDQQILNAGGIYIAANTTHQLFAGEYCSIYIDQTHFLANIIQNYLQPHTKVCALPEKLINILRHYFLTYSSTQVAFQQLIHFLAPEHNKICSDRQQIFMQLLELQAHNDLTTQQIAAALHISTSRFSHWFSEHFGISYRSYRKWRRLLQTLQGIDQRSNLTELAYNSHFADQAHFSRTCKQMFGIQPSLLKFIPEIEQLPLLIAKEP